MRVFVAGATGVLGRSLLPQLVATGYEVIGLARSPEKLLLVDRMGTSPVRGDVLDETAIRRVIAETRPKAVVNLATAIPLKLHVNPRDWETNDRIRVEGTRHLLEAAQEAGVSLFVQESVGYVCRSRGEDWIDEDAERSAHPFLRATLQMEDIVRESSVPCCLLRFAALMAADAWHTQQSIAAIRRHLLPIVGEGEAFISQIHAADAAHAICCALARSQDAAGETFNVVDDAPARMREVFPYAAMLLHAPPPRHVLPFLAKMAVGATTIEVLTASYRMSNGKIKRALGFVPRYPTYREIWAQIVAEIAGQDFQPSEDLKQP